MLKWVDSIIPEYGCSNFTTAWNDGRRLCGVVDHLRPGACPNHKALNSANGYENCQLGMDLAERLLNVPKVMDPADLNNPSIDELSVMTYLSYFCSPSNNQLLDWIQKKIPENNIKNLSTDWNDGINLAALGEACFPGLCPNWKNLEPTNAIENNEQLLQLMKDKLGLECPLSAAELADPKVDELVVATYLSQFRNAKLSASPEVFGLKVPSLPNGSALIKEPVKFEIEVAKEMADLKKDLQVTAHGPSSDVKVNLSPGENGLEAILIPTEAGSYDIVAAYQDENISGSPFNLPVADPSKCTIFGDIPSFMQVGQDESFSVKTRGAGVAQLTCKTDDSDTLDSDIKKEENEQFQVKLLPKNIGQARVRVKWANTDIPQTPFDVSICNSSKATVSGLEKEVKAGDPVSFQVTAKEDECGKAILAVVPRGPGANYMPEIKKEGNGLYNVQFVPWEVGPHKVDVEYGNWHVQGSPFSLQVIAAPDAKTCSASGKGLKFAVAGEKTTFQIFSPENGLLKKTNPVGLEIAVKSHESETDVDIKDNENGSYSVFYTPAIPGSYNVTIWFYNKQIPGSPFQLEVVPQADASKCRAYGPALHPNSLHIAGNPLDMYVDTQEAGTGDLRVTVVGPDDSKPKVFMANDEGTYSIKWDVPDHGRYFAHIWWADQYIPGSPFKLKVNPGPNAGMVKAYGPGLEPSFEIGTDTSDFTIETKDAGIGTLTIRVHGVKGAFKIQAKPVSSNDVRTLSAFYHPNQPGDYMIAIRWSGAHIPGSPFKVSIRKPASEEDTPEVKEKKEKQRPLPPNIYLSHQGDSQTNDKTSKEDDTPEPTPLAVVKEKKAKKNELKTKSEIQVEQGVDAANSSVSLPATKMRPQQMVASQQKGAVVTHIRQVKKVTTTTQKVEGSGEKKKVKKKKF